MTATAMETELSNTERQALAREAAADKYGYRNDQWQQSRTVFHQGWDAALEWVGTQRQEAYENAAVIAENCTQDSAARDEPFRIAQTIRECARREL